MIPRQLLIVVSIIFSLGLFSEAALAQKVEYQGDRILRVTKGGKNPERVRTKILRKAAKASHEEGFTYFAAIDWSNEQEFRQATLPPTYDGGTPKYISSAINHLAGRFYMLTAEEYNQYQSDYPGTEFFKVERYLKD